MKFLRSNRSMFYLNDQIGLSLYKIVVHIFEFYHSVELLARSELQNACIHDEHFKLVKKFLAGFLKMTTLLVILRQDQFCQFVYV